jgi:hypothetical protein
MGGKTAPYSELYPSGATEHLMEFRWAMMAAIFFIAPILGGCSDTYYDRRETVSSGVGDAIAVNKATQMVDPWPRDSMNTRIARNGQLVQAAQDRYNRGKAFTPVLPTATSKDYLAVQQQAASSQAATSQSTSPVTPAAPVKGASP